MLNKLNNKKYKLMAILMANADKDINIKNSYQNTNKIN